MSLSPHTKLGPYEIVASLGAGGMGEVYRARDTRLRREAAIKILPAEFSQNQDRLRRFEREAQSASALNHPNIITIYDIGSADSLTYIAMELVDGKTLREMLMGSPLPLRTILKIAAQASEGLAKAHAAGIIHRDLKPENLMITKDGFTKILDFGLAKLVYSDSDKDRETETQPGTIVGTVAYMSPEQAAGRSIDFRSDQFSFGSILYEMVAGRRPFSRKSPAETLSAIINEEPEPLTSLNRQIPAPLEWAIKRCMSKDAQERYESTRDLAKDLQTMRDHFSGVSGSTDKVIARPEMERSRKVLRFILPTLIIGFISLAFLTGKIMEKKQTTSSGAQTLKKSPFSLRQLTFRRGAIGHARFSPDGKTIIYDAAWNGNPPEIFFTQIGNPESRSLGLKDTEFFSISSNGEMAVLMRDRLKGSNILARVAFSGGAPRALSENVTAADWSPDGQSLAVIHNAKVLESPVGKKLYESQHFIRKLRFSPKGDFIAFIEIRFLEL